MSEEIRAAWRGFRRGVTLNGRLPPVLVLAAAAWDAAYWLPRLL